MSYDLDIVTKKRPEHFQIGEFVSSNSKLRLEGNLDSRGGNVIVSQKFDGGAEPIFELWGPDKAETEDLEDVVARAIQSPCWMVRITVPAAEKDTLKLAEAMAAHIAQRCEGVVYDPQAEAIVWPKMEAASPSRSPRKERIRVVTLNWYLPPFQASTSMARTFLATVEKLCPQALPIRFGVYHPLQGKLKPGEKRPFLDAVEEILQQGRAEMLELKSKSPCFGGGLWIPSRRNDPRMRMTSNYVDLELEFDGRVVESDPKWCEKLLSLFVHLATNLNAFYANSYVERGVFAMRGGIGYDEESEQYPKPSGKWKGIPSVPYWLSWFGHPYFSLVRDALKGPKVSHMKDGVLVQLGSKLQDLDELRNEHLDLPGELVSDMTRVQAETKFPSGVTVRQDRWEANPARVVLELS